ncbi:sensor histidine kinase [Streptomyces rochei]|uniref:sensor histidine kinase n=1 Tax=Streptomyces rochei TaxID=1928 RepID=UPI0036BB4844
MNRPDPTAAEGGPAATATAPGTDRSRRRWWHGLLPRPRRLRSRLALAASAAVVLVTVGVCTAAFLVLRYKLYQQVDQNLAQSATLVAREARDGEPAVLRGECRYLGAPACAQTVPPDRADDPAEPYVLPVSTAVREVAAGRRAPYYRDITVDGHPARMLTTTFSHGTAVQVALRSDVAERGVRQTAWLLSGVGGAGVVVAGLLGYAVARTGLRPVTRLTATAERVAATRDPRHRIELPPGGRHRGDETTRLATTFNTMLDELDRSVTAQRRLIADASHELRTPLTALRTNAELLTRADRLPPHRRERAAGALVRQLEDVTSLVNDLIELARDEEPQPLLEQIDLAALTRHAVDTARERWPRLTFTLDVADTAAGVLRPGIPARLARLLGNLLDNAAKFSPPDGTVEVALTERELTVRDHGPGIADEDLPHIFDRFYRAPSARALPGSGLGLAMARQIARTHGADLTAERAPGTGALFRLTL